MLAYDKEMIDTVHDIRKNLPTGLRHGIKLSNPELPDALERIFGLVKDPHTRTLIQHFFDLAKDARLNSDSSAGEPQIGSRHDDATVMHASEDALKAVKKLLAGRLFNRRHPVSEPSDTGG